MTAPDPRTLVVLAALVVGMTVTSVVLLILEPTPVAPLQGAILTSVDNEVQPEDRLFDTEAMRPWQAIVIHDSGSQSGSAKTINELHERLGRGGLGYHMVINNGSGQDDGTIELGFRWKQQFDGAYLDAGLNPDSAQVFHEQAIGVCLIGDGDNQRFTDQQLRELVWLVRQLQQELGIPAENVLVDVGSGPDLAPMFPHAAFRQQLLP